MTLPDWGEWTEVGEEHLRVVHSSPALLQGEESNEWTVEAPENWDGRLEVRYLIGARRVGTEAQRRRRTLPWCAPDYTFGFEANTLMCLDLEVSERTLHVDAPEGWSLYTAWGGMQDPAEGILLADEPGNMMIAIGTPQGAVARSKAGLIETAQFGRGPNIAPEIHRYMVDLVRAYGITTGEVITSPIRVFVLDGMSGGTKSSYGLRIGFRPELGEDQAKSESLRHLVAHELFHFWLGGKIDGGVSTIWFTEGFTDYLSLWHVTALNIVSREYFVEQILDYQARIADSSIGSVAFADESIVWRDGNGPNERMAYAGGAMLAFAIDAALFETGRGRLVDLIDQLLDKSDREFIVRDLWSFMVERGIGKMYEDLVAVPSPLPDSVGLLERVGFRRTDTPTQLAYLGLRAEDQDVPRDAPLAERLPRITMVDPSGPAAQAGMEIGDRILGYFPRRSGAVHVRPGIGPYLYGLDRLDPAAKQAFLDIIRGDTEIRVPIKVRPIDGGTIRGASPVESDELDAFFSVIRPSPQQAARTDRVVVRRHRAG